MQIDPEIPLLRQLPLKVAAETFVIRAATPSLGGSSTSLNSMLIRGTEPIIVDTGIVTAREAWFADVFSLVEPEDVRWIIVTHLDTDHSGNMLEALERCPNAILVTTPGESFRVTASFGVPAARMRLVDFGEIFDAGDRRLRSVRPPVYDSPYTRGILDESTGVYYASDAFCTPMPAHPVDRLGDMAPETWRPGMAKFHQVSLSPWLTLVDDARFRREVLALGDLELSAIVAAHAPLIDGACVRQAIEHLANLPAVLRNAGSDAPVETALAG
jgi:flavorubredoxin